MKVLRPLKSSMRLQSRVSASSSASSAGSGSEYQLDQWTFLGSKKGIEYQE